MKRFSDLEVGDELICLCSYSSLCLIYTILEITNVEIERKHINGRFNIDKNNIRSLYILGDNKEDSINNSRFAQVDKYGDIIDDEFEFIIAFENFEECKKYAIKYTINKIREHETLLNEIICW